MTQITQAFNEKFAGRNIDCGAMNDPVMEDIRTLGKRFNMKRYRVLQYGQRGLDFPHHEPSRLNIIVNSVPKPQSERVAKIVEFNIG